MPSQCFVEDLCIYLFIYFTGGLIDDLLDPSELFERRVMWQASTADDTHELSFVAEFLVKILVFHVEVIFGN